MSGKSKSQHVSDTAYPKVEGHAGGRKACTMPLGLTYINADTAYPKVEGHAGGRKACTMPLGLTYINAQSLLISCLTLMVRYHLILDVTMTCLTWRAYPANNKWQKSCFECFNRAAFRLTSR